MDLQTKISEIPKKVKQAVKLIYLSILVGIIKSVLYETMTSQKMLSIPKSLTIGIMTIILIGFLGYKIGQGKNWSRITLLVLTLIGMTEYPFIVIREFQTSPVIAIVSIVQMLIQFYALIFVFSGDSKQWFKELKGKNIEDKNTQTE